jgi:hypothetical protein
MISAKLHDFIERAIEARHISAEDVRDLRRDILPDGILTRVEAEALLALDRVLGSDGSWGAALTALIVDFVVWGPHSTGMVDNDEALWLTTALDVGGPTETAMAIAYGILDEAKRVDAALLEFIVRGRRHARLRNLAA